MEEGKESSVKQNGTATRPSLKSDSPFNKYQLWKQKLRDKCYKRVREDRTRLLWKFRCNQQEDIVRSAFQDIVSDEIDKMKNTDDVLWEYEGPPDTTYQGECQDILLEMQRIFYEDLKSQPPTLDLESDIETWEDEVDEHLARAVYEHMQLNADEAHVKEIWCPICKQGELKDSHNLIYCTHCELKLNKANELTLDFLRDRLAEVHMEHLDRGCRLKPKFVVRDRLAEVHMEHLDRGCRLKPKFGIKTKFNLTTLYISCEGCDTFEVVT